jgi:probable rRNA maturation factor
VDDDEPPPSLLRLELTENSCWKPEGDQWNDLEKAGLELARLAQVSEGELEAGVHLCDADEMKELHEKFMNDPTVTDVMSFDGDGGYLGDVVACVDVAREEGEALGHGLWPELMFYVLHGLLHNMGHDDASPQEREAMHDLQRKALRSIGVEVAS